MNLPPHIPETEAPIHRRRITDAPLNSFAPPLPPKQTTMGGETVAFEKNIGNGNTVVYVAVLTGKKELAFQTMFKKKADEFMPNNGPTPTSETTSGFLESKFT